MSDFKYNTEYEQSKKMLEAIQMVCDNIKIGLHKKEYEIYERLLQRLHQATGLCVQHFNNELENYILRSCDRLDIMKKRILDNFVNDKETKINLIESNKTKLSELYTEFNTIIVELESIKENLKNTIVNTNEIENINIEIKKYETIINQISLDIETLSI
jgi:hypothetical protein